jgi:hypothetical protein
MSDKNIVALSGAQTKGQYLSVGTVQNGQPAFIDIVTGHTFDAAGNSIGRMTPNESSAADEQNQQLSIWAANRSMSNLAQTVRGCGRSAEAGNIEAQAHALSRFANIDSSESMGQALDIGITEVHQPGALPGVVMGYRNEGGVADIYAPPVIVPHTQDKYYQFAKEDAFQRAVPSIVSPGALVDEIQPRFGATMFTCIGRGVGAFIPTELEANQDPGLQIKKAHVARCLNVVELEREIRVSGMARTSANWNSATTLASSYQWNGGANSDPVKDINKVIEDSYGNPDSMILSRRLWNAMRRNPAVRSYYTYGGTSPGILKEAEMASLLQIPTVYVNDMKYIDTSGSLVYPWGNDVTIFRKPSQIPPTDPTDIATAYTFRWVGPGMTTPDTEAGLAPSRGYVVRQFFNQVRGTLGGIQIVVCHFDAEKQTSAFIGNLLINAYQ